MYSSKRNACSFPQVKIYLFFSTLISLAFNELHALDMMCTVRASCTHVYICGKHMSMYVHVHVHVACACACIQRFLCLITVPHVHGMGLIQ